MSLVPDSNSKSNRKATVVAAIFLLASQMLRELGLKTLPTSSQAIADAVGVSRSQAYEMRSRLDNLCRDLHETSGPPPATPPDVLWQVTAAIRDFIIDHPGCIVGHGKRRRYSDGFRHFVLNLLRPDQPGHGLTLNQFAQGTGVPLGTLKLWLHGDSRSDTAGHEESPGPSEDIQSTTAQLTCDPEIATIIAEYKNWTGDFTSFCEHLRQHARVCRGRTFISSVLQATGLRVPRLRNQPKTAPWSPDTFRRLFPGAQWLGDGTTLVMDINGRRFPFVLEAIGDVASNALVGLSVTDAEDQEALLNAFDGGLQTTGGHPLSITLDNKPCNHTDAVAEAVEPTTVLPATPGRGQAKAPLEGTFGLFSQTAPPLRVTGKNQRELARSILELVVTLWAWTRNTKPRKRLGGRSAADAYVSHTPTPEQLATGRVWIAELKRRADKAKTTAERRADPARRQLLAESLSHLQIPDPNCRLEIALASYSLEAIIRGVATFRAKLDQGTIPKDADHGRYLGGIIRNIDSELELTAMAEHLLDLRLRHQQLTVMPLQQELSRLQTQHSPQDLPEIFVKRALEAQAQIDFRFFSAQAREALANLGEETATRILPYLVRTASTHFAAPKNRRASLLAELTQAAF